MLQEEASKSNDNFERYKERIFNLSGEFEFGLFMFIIRKSIFWIALFFVLAVCGAYIYLRYTQPVYEASSVIQVQNSNQANKLLNVENLYGTDNKLAEVIELLRSKVFLKRVLSKMPLALSYYAEGTFKNNELYKNSPFAVEIKQKDNTIVTSKIYVDFTSSKEGQITYTLNGKQYTKNYTVDAWINFPQFDVKVNTPNYPEIKKQQGVVKDNAFYFTINDTASIANYYFPLVEVKLLNEGANTIKISFRDFNAQKARDIVALMTQEYSSFDIERKSESAQGVIGFINQQLDLVYEQLKISEKSIQEFKKNNVVDDDAKKGSAANIERVNGLDDQVIALELEEDVLSKIEKNIAESKTIDTYNLLAMLAGTDTERTLSSVTDALHKLLIQKEEMLYQVMPNSEAIKAIDYQIGIQKNLLKESIISVKNNIRIRKNNLTDGYFARF